MRTIAKAMLECELHYIRLILVLKAPFPSMFSSSIEDFLQYHVAPLQEYRLEGRNLDHYVSETCTSCDDRHRSLR